MNAKEEFLKHVGNKSRIKCVEVDHSRFFLDKNRSFFFLPVGFTEDQLNQFLKNLDFNYDSGFGLQELGGTIWYVDGTWSSRGEYDGSEWWEFNTIPAIPLELLSKNS